ncbi:hypothetical protein ACPC2L_33530 [Rhodococcus erythropolis]
MKRRPGLSASVGEGVTTPRQSDPREPLGRDDPEHVRIVAKAGDRPLLDGQQSVPARLADGVLDRRAAHARDRSHVLDRQPAVLPPGGLSRHEGEDRLLGQREPSREPWREPPRGGPAATALHRGIRARARADGPPGGSCSILDGRTIVWVRNSRRRQGEPPGGRRIGPCFD